MQEFFRLVTTSLGVMFTFIIMGITIMFGVMMFGSSSGDESSSQWMAWFLALLFPAIGAGLTSMLWVIIMALRAWSESE